MSQLTSIQNRTVQGNVFAGPCPSRDVLKHVCSQWGLLLLIALRETKVMRFSELRRKLDGVSEKMLAQSLQALTRDGFVERTAYPVVPPHVEYSLSAMGEEVADHVSSLKGWIEDNLHRVIEQRHKNDADSGDLKANS